MDFDTKNPILGKFWKAFNGRCRYILLPFGLFCGHLEYFAPIWYISWLHICIFYGYLVYFSRFGMLNQEKKSGNPGREGRVR
jgi:hypothetical protein